MANFIPTDEEWEKIKRHVKSDRYKKEDFFVFETLAVGDKIVPNRYMRLMPDLLETMKEDAEKGVSLMLNHNWSQTGVQSIPIGKVFDARIDRGTQDGEETTLYTKQYILRDDSKVDGYSKNDIINLIESGILADTSVGWGTTREAYKCSICGNSIYDYANCKHYPGNKYIVDEDTNEVQECIIEAHSPKKKHAGNNVLMENSIVFDGAYPNAVIQSALGEEIETPTGNYKRLEGKQELSEKDLIIGFSAGGGNINLLYKPNMEKGGKLEMKGTQVNELDNKNPKVETVETDVDVANNATNDTANEVVVETVEDTTNDTVDNAVDNTQEEETMSVDKQILEKFGNICETVEELVQMAKEGLSNREKVIENSLTKGVRSMGNAFNKELFSKTFSNMKTKDIEEMGNLWETQVKEKFSTEKISETEKEPEVEELKRIDIKQFKTGNY